MSVPVARGLVSTPAGAPPAGLPLAEAVLALIDAWRLIAAGVAVSTVAVTVLAVLSPRPYEAMMTLSPVTSSPSLRSLGAAGGFAATLLNANQTGLQATPAFLVTLLRSHEVARQIAFTPLPPDSADRIIDRLARKRVTQPENWYIDRLVGRTLQAAVDRETGTISLRVVDHDSVVARRAIEAAAEAVTRAFQHVARAQATELREAQEVRVDSASNRLHRAEEQLSTFLSTNREISEYSPLVVQRQRLQMNVQLAQTVYMQAVADRESAVAKELEETPALVVLDPLPLRISQAPRRPALVAGLTAFLTAALLVSIVVLRAWWMSLLATQDPAVLRLNRILERLPGVRRSLHTR